MTNLSTNFTEFSDTNLPNVTDLKKVDQTTNKFIINKNDLTNLPIKFTENNDTNLPNVTVLKKVDQTAIKNKADLTNLPTNNLPNVTDLKKNIKQTINEFSIKSTGTTNLLTKNTENSAMNLPNVHDLNKVDQTTNVCIINNAYSTNLPTKFTEKMIRTFQM